MSKKETEQPKQREIEIEPEAVAAQIDKAIEELKEQREKIRTEKGPLKRTTFEVLEDKGLLSGNALYNEYIQIEAKQSKLSSAERKMIVQIVLEGMRRAFHIEIAKMEPEKPAIPKRKRTKKTKE